MDNEQRIEQLNGKATQLLLFLSFALVAAILLETAPMSTLTACQKVAVKWSLRFWVLSLLPILVVVIPVKGWGADDALWYKRLRVAKVVLLSFAILLIIPGAIAFLFAVW